MSSLAWWDRKQQQARPKGRIGADPQHMRIRLQVNPQWISNCSQAAST
jgi:hypothetical protein